MGFVSYSEDILKRHESDIHDLIRALESGQLGVAHQHHTVPQFEQLLLQLRTVLSDPSNPIAMRLLEIRSRAATLEVNLTQMTKKRDVLSSKNAELDKRERTSRMEVDRLRREVESLRTKHTSLQITNDDLRRKISGFEEEIARLKANEAKLTKDLFEAQVDVRYKK